MKFIIVFESKRLRALQMKHAHLLTEMHQKEDMYASMLRRTVDAEGKNHDNEDILRRLHAASKHRGELLAEALGALPTETHSDLISRIQNSLKP